MIRTLPHNSYSYLISHIICTYVLTISPYTHSTHITAYMNKYKTSTSYFGISSIRHQDRRTVASTYKYKQVPTLYGCSMLLFILSSSSCLTGRQGAPAGQQVVVLLLLLLCHMSHVSHKSAAHNTYKYKHIV
jgi:hypothetical protein